MFSKSIALPVACLAAAATAETVRGVLVFSRHGDRPFTPTPLFELDFVSHC